MDIIKEAEKHVKVIGEIFNKQRENYDHAVRAAKEAEEKALEQIEKEECGIFCRAENILKEYVIGLFITLKILILAVISYVVYKIIKCYRSGYLRV